jgi:hypothetical protein
MGFGWGDREMGGWKLVIVSVVYDQVLLCDMGVLRLVLGGVSFVIRCIGNDTVVLGLGGMGIVYVQATLSRSAYSISTSGYMDIAGESYNMR